MAKQRNEILTQRAYGRIWINFGDVLPDIESAKYHVKDLKGKFRFFKRTVTDWQEVKDGKDYK
jgi:hypothetical protein